MSIRQAISTLHQMQTDQVVERYAIGGAVGATFYLEPVATLDIDVFVAFRPEEDHLIISLQPVFDYLMKRGCTMFREAVVIAGWPVQFFPPMGPLLDEALARAVETDVGGTVARVFTAEHLAAIALQAGRAKDKARLLQFVEEGVLDFGRFQDILAEHALIDAWARFEKQFLSDTP